MIYDRRGQLRNRIQRIKETLWLKEQAPRLRRIVGNIEIEAESATEIVVGVEFYPGRTPSPSPDAWAGNTVHI